MKQEQPSTSRAKAACPLCTAARRVPILTLVLLLAAIAAAGFTVKVRHTALPAHDLIKANLAKLQRVNPNDFRFLVFSDLHTNMGTLGAITRRASSDPAVAFVVGVGDLVSDPLVGDFRFPVRELRRMKVPYFPAIGNHDKEKADDGTKLYQSIFGPLYYSFHVGKNEFVILNGSSTHGLAPEEQKWADAELASAKGDMNRFVFVHIPLRDPRGGDNHQCMLPKVGDQLAAMFKKFGVTHIFSGHLHGNFSGNWDGVPFTVLGGAGGRLHGTEPANFFHHYIEVSVKNGAVSVETKRIENSDIRFSDRLKTVEGKLWHVAGMEGFQIAGVFFAAGIVWFVFVSVRRRKCKPAAA